jgi:hypothetical protein
MSGKSTKSEIVSFRLPVDVVSTLNNRLAGRRGRWASIGEYLQERVIYDVRRLHGRRKKKR